MSGTVVDLGCCDHGDCDSLSILIREYEPDYVYGFDPLLSSHGWMPNGGTFRVKRLFLDDRVAWKDYGRIQLAVGGPILDTTVVRQKNDRGEWTNIITAESFDLAVFLHSIQAHPLVLKMNVEGAEFDLLQHLIDTGTIGLVDTLIVAWHDERMGEPLTARRQQIEQARPGILEWTIGGTR